MAEVLGFKVETLLKRGKGRRGSDAEEPKDREEVDSDKTEKIRFIMVNDVCNGRGHLFPYMETGKIRGKIGSIPHSHICD